MDTLLWTAVAVNTIGVIVVFWIDSLLRPLKLTGTKRKTIEYCDHCRKWHNAVS
jgi:hypothetical protein